jgi:hypothetical protein
MMHTRNACTAAIEPGDPIVGTRAVPGPFIGGATESNRPSVASIMGAPTLNPVGCVLTDGAQR